jgi:hypothetical protein
MLICCFFCLSRFHDYNTNVQLLCFQSIKACRTADPSACQGMSRSIADVRHKFLEAVSSSYPFISFCIEIVDNLVKITRFLVL